MHLGRMRDKSRNFWKFQKYVRMRMVKSGYNHCINGRMGVVWCCGASPAQRKTGTGGGEIMIRQKVDYGKYRYSQKEILKYIGESAALCGAVDYLFYQTPWVMLLVVPVSVFFLKWKKKQMIRERKRRLNYQFGMH